MKRTCVAHPMHITASVFINDDDSGLHHDYDEWVEKIAPHDPVSQHQHNRTGGSNADAQIKRQIMGREVVIAITEGRLDFGTWEQIFHGEFDRRRRKRELVKIIGEYQKLPTSRRSAAPKSLLRMRIHLAGRCYNGIDILNVPG